MQNRVFRRYGFAWVRGGFFLVSLIGHWVFGWLAYANEQRSRNNPVEFTARSRIG